MIETKLEKLEISLEKLELKIYKKVNEKEDEKELKTSYSN